MNYWKIMAGRGSEKIDLFLERSIIGLGWLSGESIQGMSLDQIRELYTQKEPNARLGQRIAWGAQIYKFYHELKENDRVLVYEPTTRLYHVMEVLSGASCDDKSDLHIRKVKEIGVISRDNLSTQSKNVLGGILAFYSLNQNVAEEIQAALDGKKIISEKEEALESIEEEGDNTAEQAKEFLKDRLLKLDWDEMQELVAGLLRAMGYKTSVSPAGPDRGKDIIASPDGLGLEEPRIRVEVKHRQGSQMGSSEIRSFAGGLRNNKGLYVSTGGFTREAYYEAERAQNSITLVDSEVLALFIIQYYDQFDNEARALLPLRKIYWPL